MIHRCLLQISALALAAGAFGQSYVQIVPPRVPQAIFAQSINTAGAVAGYLLDTGAGPTHGFVRAAGGEIVTFDAPIIFGNPTVGTTFAYSINVHGAIAGSFVNNTSPTESHVEGYLRDPFGNIITFDPAGSINTQALSINDRGFVAGWYNEANLVIHGFIREDSGHIITVDVPGAVATKVIAINRAGTVAGFYQAADASVNGFVRFAGGAIITFDPPDSTQTTVTDIDASGDISGFFTLASGRTFGFIRRAGGEIVTFDVSDSIGTFPAHISDAGEIAGQYSDASGLHGFIRSADGVLAPFAPPDNCPGAMFPTSVNVGGLISGWCITTSPGLLSRAAWIRLPQ